MSWVGRRVLVTGAGGFIGSHLVERLVREGAEVRALVHYNALGAIGNLALLPAEVLHAVEVLPSDVTDGSAMREAVAGCGWVFHLAALIGIPYSYRAPLSYVRTNVEGTLNLLEASRDVGIDRFIHTSTSECYGTARYTPIDEEHPLVGQSPYSASKIGADQMAVAYHRAFGLPAVIIRPFNTYGPRQSERAVIPTIIAQALSELPEIRLGDLEPVRDLTWVEDTVAGFLAGATAEDAPGGTFNLGTGEAVSIGDLARRILAVAGVEKPIVEEKGRLRPARSEVYTLIADNRRARERLGWLPGCGLDEGLARTVAFVRAHPERYRPGTYAV